MKASKRPISRDSVDQRLIDLAVPGGWKAEVNTHVVGFGGLRDFERYEEDYPSRYPGVHWLTATDKAGETHMRGIMLDVRPVYWRQREGYSGFNTGVFPSIHDALDAALDYIEAQEARLR